MKVKAEGFPESIKFPLHPGCSAGVMFLLRFKREVPGGCIEGRHLGPHALSICCRGTPRVF